MVRAISRILAVCLLLAGHVPLVAFARTSECEMACCRKAVDASCHRKHTHSGPGFQSAPCASHCVAVQSGMAPAVVQTAPAVVAEPLFVAWITPRAVDQTASVSQDRTAWQLPPPAPQL